MDHELFQRAARARAQARAARVHRQRPPGGPAESDVEIALVEELAWANARADSAAAHVLDLEGELREARSEYDILGAELVASNREAQTLLQELDAAQRRLDDAALDASRLRERAGSLRVNRPRHRRLAVLVGDGRSRIAGRR